MLAVWLAQLVRMMGMVLWSCSAGMMLRGVKDWVHRKTAKIIHDFNSFCNLDMNQKRVSVMIIKSVTFVHYTMR